MKDQAHRGPLISAGTLLGVGLGGFIDGIVFQRILQWHHLLSNVVTPSDLTALKYNLIWDGVFELFSCLMTAAGLTLLWRAGQTADVPWSTRTFVGSLSLGWGLFNLLEGFFAHHYLSLHHVRPGSYQLAWDLTFLVFGTLLTVAGWALIQNGRRDQIPRGFRYMSGLRGGLPN